MNYVFVENVPVILSSEVYVCIISFNSKNKSYRVQFKHNKEQKCIILNSFTKTPSIAQIEDILTYTVDCIKNGKDYLDEISLRDYESIIKDSIKNLK